MIAPCREVGHASYERLRAHAMVLPLRYTGLRISDVALLGREPVTDGQIPLDPYKTGAHAHRFRHTLATELWRAVEASGTLPTF
jgi:integrase